MAIKIMRKRIGNDFLFYWIIKENNVIINPDSVIDFKVTIRNRRTGYEIVAKFDVVNSSPSIKCENLLSLGIYDLIATWKTVDYSFEDGYRDCTADVQAFEIVSSSSSECETDLTITSDIAIGFEGADAFDVWLKNGNEGKTYEDYIAFLQQPATDAADLANSAAQEANTATGLTIAAKDDYYNIVKPEIIAQGEYATAQGDYAKAQGEAVDVAITDLQANSEIKVNKTSDVESNKTSVEKYPNVKGVVDYVAEQGAAKVDKVDGKSLVDDTEIDKLAEYPAFEDLEFSHDNLTDKNSEAGFQHVDTTTTKEALDEADKVALWDSESGKVVLTPKDNLESECLIIDYTHSANTEIVVTNVDVDTNTFTMANHGMSNGATICPTLNDSNNTSIYPLQVYSGGIKQQAYYVVNKTDNTFQVSATVGGAPIDITSTGDLSKWHFEISPASAITFTGLNSKRYRLIVEGKNLVQSANQYLLINDLNMTSTWMTPILTTFSLPFVNISGFTLRGYLDILVEVGTDLFTTIRTIGNVYNVNNNNASAFTVTTINNTLIQSIKGKYSNITQLTFNDIGRLANGSKIKIYRL